MTAQEELELAFQSLWESVNAGDGDFCGEQREWHLPRLQKALTLLTKHHPEASVNGFKVAESPFGGLISDE